MNTTLIRNPSLLVIAFSAIALHVDAPAAQSAPFEPAWMQQAGRGIARKLKEDAETNGKKKEGQVNGEGQQPAGSNKPAEKKTTAKTAPVPPKAAALAFKLKDIDGNERDLNEYAGKVVLMVNTASKCGYTPQYGALQELYKQHESRGFVVLAFPANNFGAQEPGPDADIKQFCTDKYQITFPLFAKIEVKGKDIAPLYKYLTGLNVGHKFGGDIKWNFTKFLINRKGQVIGRFDSKEDPLTGKKITAALKKALDEPRPGETKEAPKPKTKP